MKVRLLVLRMVAALTLGAAVVQVPVLAQGASKEDGLFTIRIGQQPQRWALECKHPAIPSRQRDVTLCRGSSSSDWLPAMWQQFFDPTGLVRRQAGQNILQIRKRIMPVEFG